VFFEVLSPGRQTAELALDPGGYGPKEAFAIGDNGCDDCRFKRASVAKFASHPRNLIALAAFGADIRRKMTEGLCCFCRSACPCDERGCIQSSAQA
jgi:hypothetical protein